MSNERSHHEMDLETWKRKMYQVFAFMTSEENDALLKTIDMALSDEEKKLRKEIAELPYYDGFDKRLDLLQRFANRKNVDDKVEHVFSTIINGVRTGIEMRSNDVKNPQELEAQNEILQEKIRKSFLTVDQGKELIIRAIRFVQTQGWQDSLSELMRIWDKKAELILNNPEDKMSWAGGGQQLAMMLGSEQEPWDPFDLFGMRPERK